MISSPHLSTALLHNVLQRWSLYLNRCVAAFVSEALEDLGANVPFSLDQIIVELKGRRYVGPIWQQRLVIVCRVVASPFLQGATMEAWLG